MDTLNKAKVLIFIGTEPSDEDLEVLKTVHDLIKGQVDTRVQESLPYGPALPDRLAYLMVEAVIERYNRIGSEGLSKESVEGHGATYDYKAMDKLMGALDDWIDDELGNTGPRIVRFI